MVENWDLEPLDPTPNYDCHVSKLANSSDKFESSQVLAMLHNLNIKILTVINNSSPTIALYNSGVPVG